MRSTYQGLRRRVVTFPWEFLLKMKCFNIWKYHWYGDKLWLVDDIWSPFGAITVIYDDIIWNNSEWVPPNQSLQYQQWLSNEPNEVLNMWGRDCEVDSTMTLCAVANCVRISSYQFWGVKHVEHSLLMLDVSHTNPMTCQSRPGPAKSVAHHQPEPSGTVGPEFKQSLVTHWSNIICYLATWWRLINDEHLLISKVIKNMCKTYVYIYICIGVTPPH